MWRDWVVDAKSIALGPLHMRHAAFYRLTPREFHDLVDGWLWRERRREEQEARWVAALMNALGVKPQMTAAKLLGRPIGPLRETSETKVTTP